jgi:hypothetical protein
MRSITYLTFCVLIVFSLANSVHPQAAKSELVGEVRDQNGALVQNAKVSLTDVSAGQTSSKLSDDGTFLMTNLKPGVYNVAVEANGFKQSVREGVRLATGERVRLDVSSRIRTCPHRSKRLRASSTPQRFQSRHSSRSATARGTRCVVQPIATWTWR